MIVGGQSPRPFIPRDNSCCDQFDAHTCVCIFFLKWLYLWEHNLWNTHPNPDVLYDCSSLRNLVVLCHGRYAHMYKKPSTSTECVKRRMCSGDSSLSCMSGTFAYTRCFLPTNIPQNLDNKVVPTDWHECLKSPTDGRFGLRLPTNGSFVWISPTDSHFEFLFLHWVHDKQPTKTSITMNK